MSNWILVTEKLPENDGEYLVTYILEGKADVYTLMYFTNIDELHDKAGWYDWSEYNCDYIDFEAPNCRVAAWMPWPDTYKEAENVPTST